MITEDFPDFSDKKVREMIRIKYCAGSAEYSFIEEHCKQDTKFLNGNNLSLGALADLLDSCLSGQDDFEGVR